MSPASSDRNLLFGILALQMEFVTREQLIAAMHAWKSDRSKALGEILLEHGALTEQRRRLLDELVQEHIANHGDSLEQSLTSACTRDQLGPEFQANHVREVWANLDQTLSFEGQPPPNAPEASGVPLEPSRVAGGRFRVLSLHDKGGLGQVMLATDAELGRTVALKEIRPSQADDPDSRQRFLLEAEVTGGLEHPCVVPVYGCGTYPDGRPYYAMRFIRGDDLGKAIRRFHDPAVPRPPGVQLVELHQLLRRFLDVCNAVQYAHSRGVLHRDIKPANVMLGKYGETLLVDWGLAKLIGRDETNRDSGEMTLHLPSSGGSNATLYGSAVGTPAYMSPEQAAGKLDELRPASDVYSLGATLYCLLTGQAPFAKRQGNILKLVQAGDFTPPRQVQPDIAPALEAICLKAMALLPDKRYASPAELIGDIEHWLADEPTSAYPETRSERAARWMRRHRARVQAAAIALTATAVILLLATFLVTRAWRSEKTAHALATHSKQQAVARFVQARDAVDKWLTGAGHALGYYPGVQKTRERLLELAAQDYERFVQQSSDDPELELERGRTYLRLGHLRLELRSASGAREAYQAAETLFAELAQRHPEHLACLVELANCRTDLGVVAMETGKVAEADEAYQAAIAQLETVLQKDPAQSRPRAALAKVLLDRGELLAETGRREAAEPVLKRCVELLTTLVQEDSQSVEHQVSLVNARELLGRVLLDGGRYAGAIQNLQAAVDQATDLTAAEPGDPRRLEARASASLYLASGLRVLGRAEEEVRAYRHAIQDYDALVEALPGVSKFRESRALTQTDLASLCYKLGRLTEAEQELPPAQQVLQQLMTEHPGFPRYVDEWAYSRDVQGEILRERGQTAEAKQACQEAIAAYEQLLQKPAGEAAATDVTRPAESLGLCRSHLGQTYQLQEDFDAADQAFRSAIDTLTAAAATAPLVRDKLALVHRHRAALCAQQGRPAEAAQESGAARRIWLELAAANGAPAEHRYHLAWWLANGPVPELRDPDQASDLARQLTAEAPGNAAYWNCLGVASYRAGRWESAAEMLEKAARLRGFDDARDWCFLALARWQLKDEERAHAARQRGRQALAKVPGNLELRQIMQEVDRLFRESPDAAPGTKQE